MPITGYFHHPCHRPSLIKAWSVRTAHPQSPSGFRYLLIYFRWLCVCLHLVTVNSPASVNEIDNYDVVWWKIQMNPCQMLQLMALVISVRRLHGLNLYWTRLCWKDISVTQTLVSVSRVILNSARSANSAVVRKSLQLAPVASSEWAKYMVLSAI